MHYSHMHVMFCSKQRTSIFWILAINYVLVIIWLIFTFHYLRDSESERESFSPWFAQVDALGVLQTGIIPPMEQTAESLQGQAGMPTRSTDPGTHNSHLKQHLDKLFVEWTREREIMVTKVLQDSPLQEVFCDA